MVNLANSGMGIIVISDDIPELYTITNRVLIMKQGRIIYEMESEDSTEKDINDILLDRIKV
jgi:ABC-type sugar transport system ATPase subunit